MQSLSGQNLSGKRKCLTSCEIAKSQQRIYKARSSSYTWVAYPCCIFRCLAIPTREYGGQPTFFNNKHCKSSKLAVCGNSCKIRHYEQCNYVDKHSHAFLLCLLRIFACTEKKPQAVAMVLKLLAKWFYWAYSACLFTYLRV